MSSGRACSGAVRCARPGGGRKPAERGPGKHGPLALGTPTVAAEPAVLAQHVLAGDEPRHWIGADRVPDRLGPAGDTRRAGECGIGRGTCRAELEQCTPDVDLEVGAPDCELQRPTLTAAGRCRVPDSARQACRLLVITILARVWPKCAQLPLRRGLAARLDESQMAEAPRGPREESGTKRCGAEAVAHVHAEASRLHFTGRQGIERDQEVVEPSRT